MEFNMSKEEFEKLLIEKGIDKEQNEYQIALRRFDDVISFNCNYSKGKCFEILGDIKSATICYLKYLDTIQLDELEDLNLKDKTAVYEIAVFFKYKCNNLEISDKLFRRCIDSYDGTRPKRCFEFVNYSDYIKNECFNPHAACEVGDIYAGKYKDTNIQIDMKKAVEFWKIAADSFLSEHCLNRELDKENGSIDEEAFCHCCEEVGHYYREKGDINNMIKYYKYSPYGCNVIGDNYFFGINVDQSYDKALQYYEMVLKEENEAYYPCFALGYCYLKKGDYAKAYEWFNNCGETDRFDYYGGAIGISIMYYNGLGESARDLLDLVDEYYSEISDNYEELNYWEAFWYYLMATEFGESIDYKYMLGKCYYHGYYVPKNEQKALEIYNEIQKNYSDLPKMELKDFYKYLLLSSLLYEKSPSYSTNMNCDNIDDEEFDDFDEEFDELLDE